MHSNDRNYQITALQATNTRQYTVTAHSNNEYCPINKVIDVTKTFYTAI